MHHEIAKIVGDFEQGRLTRREVTARLVGLVAVAAGIGSDAAARQEARGTFQATGLNHVALRVTDIARSRDFYIQHLGLKVARESGSSCFLTFGEDFLALFRGPEAKMDHYCYAVRDYSVESAAEKLRAQGLVPRTQGNRIYFDDPDGLEVQLSAARHTP